MYGIECIRHAYGQQLFSLFWRACEASTSSTAIDPSMSERNSKKWSKYADSYDPIRIGSIDGTDTYPHDHGIVRALNSTYKPNERVVGNPRHTVFVGRLHMKTNEDTLKHKFRKYGKIVRCRIVRDVVTGQSKQYGFIEFDSRDCVHDAVKHMKSRVDDNEVIVDYEHERLMEGWKPRRLGGGFGGRKESGQLRFGGRARPFQKPYDELRPMTSDDLKEVFRHRKYSKKRSDRD